MQSSRNYELMYIDDYVPRNTRPNADVRQQILKIYSLRKNYTHQFLKRLLMFISLPI